VVKKSAFLFLFLIIGLSCSCQVLVRASTLKLTEDYGRIYQPALGLEVGYFSNDTSQHVQVTGSIGYFRSGTKVDQTFEYSLLDNGDETNFLVSSNTYENLLVIPITITGVYKVFKKTFTPIIATSLTAYFGNYELVSEDIHGSINGKQSISGFGAKPEVGFLFTPSAKLQMQLSVGKTISTPLKGEKFQYWQIGLTGLYYL